MNSKKGKKKPKPTPVIVKSEDNKNVQETTGEPENLEAKSSNIEPISEPVEADIKLEDVAPKKPKRNRGKKKKQDKEEELNQENNPDDVETEICQTSTLRDVRDSKLDMKVSEEDNLSSVSVSAEVEYLKETLTPIISKKENKEKENKINTEKKVETEGQVTKEPEISHVDESVTLISKRETENTKKSNKKNKKKKRHDSEKSDKFEEVTCTAAFQELIKSDEEKPIVPLQEQITTECIATEAVKADFFKLSGINTEGESINKIKEESESSGATKQDIHEADKPSKDQENKNKKKNKKEKKHSKVLIDGSEEQTLDTPAPKKTFLDDSVPSEIKDSVEVTVESRVKEGVLEGVVEDVSRDPEIVNLKAKPVIVKPVEKKRKEKEDSEEVEMSKKPDECVSESSECKVQNPTGLKETEISIQENTPNTELEYLPDDKTQDLPKVYKAVGLIQEVDVIKTPDNAMGKKRKNSPKPPKIDISIPIIMKGDTADISKGEMCEMAAVLTAINPEVSSPPEISAQSEYKSDSSLKVAPLPKSRKKGKKSKTPVTPGVTDFMPTFDTEPKLLAEQFKVEISEKLSTVDDAPKSQENINLQFEDIKISDKIGIDNLSNIPTDFTTETLTCENKSKDVVEEPLLIDSPKSDVETPTLDIIPDIHYPRSSSQGHDGNNNTVITEARPDDLQLPILIDLPVIKGSGETPVETPQMISSDIIISEVSEEAKSKEKTDLKSKMLEVNRDMEELRMSIERSLAGFTAIEKSEETIEKEYEEKMKTDVINRDISLMESHRGEAEEKSVTGIDEEKLLLLGSKDDNFPESKDAVIETKVVDIPPKEDMLSENLIADDVITSQTSKVLRANPEVISDQKDLKIYIKDQTQEIKCSDASLPAYPARKDNKGKHKKKKGKHEASQSTSQSTQSTAEVKDIGNKDKQEEKCEKSEDKSQSQEKSKQADTESREPAQELTSNINECADATNEFNVGFDPIENFEDALTSSTEDAEINKSFDMIVKQTNAETELNQQKLAANKPEIKIIGPDEKLKENVTPPKNLLGHPNISVLSNKIDYKKEKNKTPNTKTAKVKIKDSEDVELPENFKTNNDTKLETDKAENKTTQLKSINIDTKLQTNMNGGQETNHLQIDKLSNNESIKDINHKVKKCSQTQTEKKNKKSTKNIESFTQLNENEHFVYKYSFRKVFLQNACHVCKNVLKVRVPCNFCNLLFYCSNKHKDEDWPQHQALCFAISTIGHLKEQKYVYADAKNITGQNYRLMRMQMILSCERVLKRRLVPWEQEVLLYPRICAEVTCRQWKQSKLKDCDGCGQISYCMDKPEHLPKTHQRWCKSYSLYQNLVIHQQTKGRLEPRMPTKVMAHPYQIPDKINEVLASMYEGKIDMTDIQYAALTQLATAPLTAAYAYQAYTHKVHPTTNGITKKSTFTIHVVGAELQFEADVLYKWELFFLHLRPDIQELKVVLISTDLNPSNLPLDLLGNIKHCEHCQASKRRVSFSFQDKKKYTEYRSSPEYCYPDLICAFNPSIQRSSIHKDLDIWPTTLNTILRNKIPFLITAYSITELMRDLQRIKESLDVDHKIVIEAKYNSFASVRPDRNFITDDEMPLLFKNYCFMVISGC